MASKVNLDISERLDITCRKGDTFSLTITLKNSSGTALTLSTSNYSFLMQVWDTSKKSTIPVIGSKNLGRQTEVSFEDFTVDDSGNVTISATATTMRAIDAGRYKYDLQYVLPVSGAENTHTTILYGSFAVNDDVSKSL
tara:strand:+ start:3997 stop:4413 length:417 start_codon:yes stop_codon:yes gene_type:complete